jgi:hypothetical protein
MGDVMIDAPEVKTRRFSRPLILSLLGIGMLSPVPLLSGNPELAPTWFSAGIGGVPLFPIIVLLLMVGMVGLALLCLDDQDATDA